MEGVNLLDTGQKQPLHKQDDALQAAPMAWKKTADLLSGRGSSVGSYVCADE